MTMMMIMMDDDDDDDDEDGYYILIKLRHLYCAKSTDADDTTYQ